MKKKSIPSAPAAPAASATTAIESSKAKAAVGIAPAIASTKAAMADKVAKPAAKKKVAAAKVLPVAAKVDASGLPKVAKPAKPVVAPAVKLKVPAAATLVEVKKVREKLVRDSFTLPKEDHRLIKQLKERAITLQRETKKSELVRAALHALAALNDTQLMKALSSLSVLTSGRPKGKN